MSKIICTILVNFFNTCSPQIQQWHWENYVEHVFCWFSFCTLYFKSISEVEHYYALLCHGGHHKNSQAGISTLAPDWLRKVTWQSNKGQSFFAWRCLDREISNKENIYSSSFNFGQYSEHLILFYFTRLEAISGRRNKLLKTKMAAWLAGDSFSSWQKVRFSDLLPTTWRNPTPYRLQLII